LDAPSEFGQFVRCALFVTGVFNDKVYDNRRFAGRITADIYPHLTDASGRIQVVNGVTNLFRGHTLTMSFPL